MKLDLRNQIDIDIRLINVCISKHNWHAIDDDLLEKDGLEKDPLSKLSIVIFPVILHYGGQSHIWYACSFEIPKSLIKDAQLYFLDLFKTFDYKPFKDEDAIAMHFAPYSRCTTRPKLKINNFKKYLLSKKYIKTGFFLNPDYPNGYWVNHTIDTIRL